MNWLPVTDSGFGDEDELTGWAGGGVKDVGLGEVDVYYFIIRGVANNFKGGF